MADDDWQPVGKPTIPTDTSAADWQPVNADFEARFSAVDTPRPFLDRLERAYHGGLSRMGEIAVGGLKQLGKGVGQIRGTTAPEPLSDTVKQAFGISPEANAERIAADQRHWQIARGFGNVAAGSAEYMGSFLGLLSGGLQGATESYTQNPYPQEATEIFGGVIGPAFVKWGSDAMKFAKATEVGEKIIGQLPNDRDFKAGAQALLTKHAEAAQEGIGKVKETTENVVNLDDQRDKLATADGNLRRLWQERGLHPAEAVDEASRNALGRHDLINQPSHPPDNSGIPPVLNSPQPQGVARSTLAQTGAPHVDAIINSEPVRTVIDDPIVNRKYDVPYTAGGSVPEADRTFFIDKNFPRSFTIDGVTFDPAEPFAVHENIEQATMNILMDVGKMDPATAYKVAHFEFAEKAEGAWYKAHGIDQEKAEAAYAPYMAAIQRGNGAMIPHDASGIAGNVPERPAVPREHLLDLANRGASVEEYNAHPEIIAARARAAEVPVSATEEQLRNPDFLARRTYNFNGQEVTGFDHAVERLRNVAENYSTDGPVKRDRVATIIIGPPASGKSTIAEDLARRQHAAIADPDDAKKIIPGFNGGIGSNAVHEESSALSRKVLEHLIDDGSNVIIPKVGLSADSIRKTANLLKAQGYKVNLTLLSADEKTLLSNVMRRYVNTGRFVPPENVVEAGSKPKETYLSLKREGIFDGTTEITAADFVRIRGGGRQVPPRGAAAVARQAQAEAAGAEGGGAAREVGNFPPNLYTRPYPHDQPSAAASEAIAEPKPTREEIARAAQIIEDAQTEGKLHSLGAAATGAVPPLTPLAKQPLSLPGRLSAAGRYYADQLFSLGRNIQGMLDPMSMGSNRAMVIAEDAMNAVRAIRWNRLRVDADIRERFTAEQQERMYNAMQEESIARQLNEPREHQGYATLTPAERSYVEGLERRGQAAWTHMLDADMVEGEGLPAWSPRILINLAMGGEGLGPRALNELGRNVFTRTAQMRHRKYMDPEETEAAAKAGLKEIMEKRGASAAEIKEAVDKIQIVRNIRTLPQAIAREEEAVVWKTMIDRIQEVGKAAGTPTVADHQVDKDWFTIAGNPAFTRWVPDLVPAETETAFKAASGEEMRGAMIPRLDQDGKVIFRPQPIWVAPDFRGPLTAILSPTTGNIWGRSIYDGLMAVKARSMTAIMNSPLIHNEVVLSKVAEAVHFREWGGLHLYWRGNRVMNSPRAIELINRGLNPIGPRGSFQDITAELEQPSFKPGRSWTSQVLGFIPGLFKPGADAAVERAIDKAGDFTHNTLLWDRIRDLQFGLADHLSDRLVAEGQPRVVADRMAAYFSNITIGSLPKESMSTGARMTANLLLFSRSFTVGNLLMYRSAVNGLPKPLLAQIERDYGISAAEGAEAAGEKMAGLLKDARAQARRRAISTIALSIGLYYVGNALLQNALNIAVNGSDLPDELKGYARRYSDLISTVRDDPWEIRHAIARLSPTWDNEPGKQDRALAGYDRDGTGIYVRNPMGKYGEELLGYPTMPAEMVTRKLSPMFGGFLGVLENNRGFGKRIYDENDTSDYAALWTGWNVGKYMVERQLPMMQLQGGYDLLTGHGDAKVAALRFAAPIFGFTASEGAPGGPARGEQLAVKNAYESRFDVAWPAIKRQIQDGNEAAARDALTRLGTPPPMIKALIRNAKNPSMSLRGRTIRDFYSEASPEARSRFERDFAPSR